MKLNSILFFGSLKVILKGVQAKKSCTIKKYKDLKNNALNLCDITTVTVDEQKLRGSYQNL